MINPERLLCAPIELARLAGRLVLYATDKAVPMKPTGLPASIQYYQTPERPDND